MIEEPATKGEIVDECGARFEVFLLPNDEDTLLNVLKDCFAEWRHIRIGPLIPGALWEIRPPGEPSITADNGYATVDFHDWHVHLCIGEREGVRPELAQIRRTSRVELFRRLDRWEQAFRWGLRLLNGAGQEQITFSLPSPFLTDDEQATSEPDWGRLALWNRLRRKYLGVGPDPVDSGFQGCSLG